MGKNWEKCLARFRALGVLGTAFAAGAGCESEGGESIANRSESLLPRPTGIAPVGPTSSPPAYRFGPIAGASSYRIWTSLSNVKVHEQTFTAVAAGCPGGTEPECVFTPGVVLPPGPLTWWVQGIESSGAQGPWSPGLSFSVNAVATLIAPSGSVAVATPAYQWNSVPGATSYTLWVSDAVANPKLNLVISAADAGCAAGGVCSTTPATAITGKASWWVRAGAGGWSARGLFEVQQQLCTASEVRRSMRLVEVAALGMESRLVVKNTSQACPVAFRDLELCYSDLLHGSGELLCMNTQNRGLPDRPLVPQEEHAAVTPWVQLWAGEHVLLCEGTCTNTANVVDAFTSSLALPSPLAMVPGPFPFIPAHAAAAYSFQRRAFAGQAPTFQASDWEIRERADNPCPPFSVLNQELSCDPHEDLFSCPPVAPVGGPTSSIRFCRCSHVNDPNVDAYWWRCEP